MGVKDYFKINLTEAKNLRVTVNNAGLPSSDTVLTSLFNRDNTHVTSSDGNRNYARLTRDIRLDYEPHYHGFTFEEDGRGYWKILVTEYVNFDKPTPDGSGDPPACFSGSGYSLQVEFLP